MNNLKIYDKLTWQKWLVTYKDHIRCFVMWDELKDFETDLIRLNGISKYAVYKSWHTAGTWVSGKPEPLVEFNAKNIIFRSPGLLINTSNPRIILLDGNHRVTIFKPGTLFVDVVIVTEENRHCFGDLLNINTRDWFNE